MKIIHTADIHLDSKLTTHLKGENKKIRLAEILDTFKRMVEYAHQNNVSAIIIAGDFFDSQTVSEVNKRYVFDLIENYSEIDFLYLCGNHDEGKNVLQNRNLPANLKTFSNELTTHPYQHVDITGIELDESNYKNFYSKINLNKEKPNIFVLHGEVGTGVIKDNYESISLKMLEDKDIDYLALGHYHTYQEGKLGGRGVYVYSGCLEGRGFDETGEKGFVELEILGNKIKHKFVSFSKRLVEIISVDITAANGYLEVAKLVESQLENASKNSLIKFELVGDVLPENKVDVNQLNYEFGNRAFFVKFEDKTKLKIIIEDWLGDKSLKGEFVTLVDSLKIDEKLKHDIIHLGIKTLDGERL